MVSVVIPNWNGRRWLPGCLAALAAQERPADQVILVDNGSTDGSLEYLAASHPEVFVIPLEWNTGFAHAANVGVRAAHGELVALINTDVELAPDWVARMERRLVDDPAAASVACKMLSLDRPSVVYDAGDILRRDGACEQRGRFELDRGDWDQPGEVFGACAGAALYRREALVALGGFDERYFAYLEDVDLALRLRLAGWGCLYEPVVALHAGEGSSHQLSGSHVYLVARNTLLLMAKSFPVAWLPLVAYRQASSLWHAARSRRLRPHLRGLGAGVAVGIRAAFSDRRRLRATARVPISEAVPPRPIRGRAAGGHPSRHA